MDQKTPWRPHVVIVGAGLGGLLLAQTLRKQEISFEIYDRDASPTARYQGWAIAIHTILDDLIASIPQDVPSIYKTSHLLPLDLQPQMSFYVKGQKMLVESNEQKTDVIRANRMKLRETLSHNIEVQWSKKASSVQRTGGGGFTVMFSDGSCCTGDILVGADGINSTVRTFLTDQKPQIVPVGTIIAEPTLTKTQLDHQLHLSHSSYAAIGLGYHLFVGLSKVADDGQSARFYWWLLWEDQELASNDEKPHWTAEASAKERYDFVIEHAEPLAPELRAILKWTKIEDIRPTLVFRDLILDSLPEGPIVLLGDAAHPMTPFKGEGGVHALIDALSLGRAISRIKARENIEEALAEYTKEVLSRGSGAVRGSRAVTDQRMGQRGGAIHAWGRQVKEGAWDKTAAPDTC